MRNLNDYAEDMQKHSDSPDALANLLIEISAHYAYLVEQHIILKLEKAKWEDVAKFKYTEDGKEQEREKPLSDKAVEQKWRITKTGIKEYSMRRNIEALRNIKKDLNTILFAKTMEARNS